MSRSGPPVRHGSGSRTSRGGRVAVDMGARETLAGGVALETGSGVIVAPGGHGWRLVSTVESLSPLRGGARDMPGRW